MSKISKKASKIKKCRFRNDKFKGIIFKIGLLFSRINNCESEKPKNSKTRKIHVDV